LAPANWRFVTCSIKRLNQLVTEALKVPLAIVVGYELGNRAAKMALPQQDHALEALLPP
jgi:hypothetical protein